MSQYLPALNPTLCLPLEQWTNISFLHLKVMLSSLLLSHNFTLIHKILCSFSPLPHCPLISLPLPWLPRRSCLILGVLYTCTYMFVHVYLVLTCRSMDLGNFLYHRPLNGGYITRGYDSPPDFTALAPRGRMETPGPSSIQLVQITGGRICA